jgi:prepilin-type N-terminal cleavage/methylation domain-containing protein
MKLKIPAKIHAFTLTEMMIAIAIGSIILGVTLTSSIALQKSFSAADNYFGAHMQQIRIVDYLARDVRRGFSVTSSLDKQTVTVKIPKYIIQAADSDATPSTIGTPRSPTLAVSNGDYNINYGTPTNQITTVEYKISGSSIQRTETENGVSVVTTIASSTDVLIPETIDIELANTEYTTTAITFKPISVADRSGTVVYSTAYLRNRRRSL